jgi:CubicO group peptidase (beta-lactamase class C family)
MLESSGIMEKRTPLSELIVIICGVVLFVTAGITQTHDSVKYWPAREWRTSTPEQQGMDSETLSQAFDLIRSRNMNIHSMQIIRNGYLVLDAYFYPYPENSVHDMASVTKSIVSILTGIAVDKGFIPSVDTPVIELFPGHEIFNLGENKRGLTLKSLLTMTSGYDCGYQGGEPQLFDMRKSDDWVQYMLDMPVIHEPGTRFSYCSGNFHLLAGIIRKVTGMTPKEFARKYLFAPLGIKGVIWPADPDGIQFGWGDLHLHPADMARIGYLFLNNGKWDDRQIVSSGWIRRSTQRSVRLSDNEYYGYGWWVRPEPEPGIYEALGRAGQRIVVWPAKNMVVVFTGGGFEPGDIGGFVVNAVKSSEPLPQNDHAYADLCQKVEAAAASPPPQPLTGLPEIAQKISGKEYICEDNQIGFRQITLFFPDADYGIIRIVRNDATLEIPFGMDGIYRVSRTGDFGLPRASKGFWQAENRLVLTLYQVSRMDHDEIDLTFDDNRVLIRMDETKLKAVYQKTG